MEHVRSHRTDARERVDGSEHADASEHADGQDTANAPSHAAKEARAISSSWRFWHGRGSGGVFGSWSS